MPWRNIRDGLPRLRRNPDRWVGERGRGAAADGALAHKGTTTPANPYGQTPARAPIKLGYLQQEPWGAVAVEIASIAPTFTARLQVDEGDNAICCSRATNYASAESHKSDDERWLGSR